MTRASLRRRIRFLVRIGLSTAALLFCGFGYTEDLAPASISASGRSSRSKSTILGGIAAGQTLYRLPMLARERQLNMISTTGLTFVRSDLFWAEVQPLPGRFYWNHTDSFMAALARHHLRWLVILDYSTRWDTRHPGARPSPPARVPSYLAYVRAVVQRYGRNGTFWRTYPGLPPEPVTMFEIWNEPNSPSFWYPHPDAAAYARLYLSARLLLHTLDPRVTVISGGLAAYPVLDTYSYINAMFKAVPSLRSNLDALGWHAYAPEAATSLARLRKVRAILTRNGAAKVPIDVTEFGWPTAGFGAISETSRAQELATFVHVAASMCGIGLLSAYTWLTREENNSNREDWYGLANLNDTLKPSGLSYANALREAVGTLQLPNC